MRCCSGSGRWARRPVTRAAEAVFIVNAAGTGGGRTALLVRIANALHTTLDALVYDSLNAVKDAYDKDFHDLIQGCSVRERAAIYRAAEQMKDTLKK